MLKFDIVTLFPKMFESPFAESIIHRAQKEGKIEIATHQLRDYATDKHKTTDDTPYGGGPGMVIKVDVVDRVISKLETRNSKLKNSRVIMMSASGERFTQQKAIELAKYDNIILLCGHYEGFDFRIHEHLVDEEISIGDYVLTGGEIPAMVIIDAVTRMIPGVIRKESIENESFMQQDTRYKKSFDILWTPSGQETNKSQISNPKSQIKSDYGKSGIDKILKASSYKLKAIYDYPAYTRPALYKGWRVPAVLQNGNHAEINKWRNDHIKKEKPVSG